MAHVRVTRPFFGSAINRDELGLVDEASELEVSSNDAQYLEREGLAERIATAEPETAPTGLTTASRAGAPTEAPTEPITPTDAPPVEPSTPPEGGTKTEAVTAEDALHSDGDAETTPTVEPPTT